MKTSNQAIQNLRRHARHVATIGLTSIGLAAVMSGSALAQTHHSGERSDDFTMMPRNMTPLSPVNCPDGKIAVGSTCVDVPVQSGGTRSWVSYFLGQSRPVLGVNSVTEAIATINQDGTTTFRPVANRNVWWPMGIETAGIPLQHYSAAGPDHFGYCWIGQFVTYPVFTESDRLYGRPPSDWAAASFWLDYNCPPPLGI